MTNQEIQDIFGDKWSLNPENFSKRCKAIDLNPEEAKKELFRLGCAKELGIGHIEYIKEIEE